VKLPLALLLLTLLVTISPAVAQSQSEMNDEATASFEKADKELNRVYAKVLAGLDTEGRAKLKAVQRAWVVWRDAQADFSADQEARGGSMEAMIYDGTRARLTKARIAELRKLATDQ
jgi:uncharacterized protein YecT (DUF1311 family)